MHCPHCGYPAKRPDRICTECGGELRNQSRLRPSSSFGNAIDVLRFKGWMPGAWITPDPMLRNDRWIAMISGCLLLFFTLFISSQYRTVYSRGTTGAANHEIIEGRELSRIGLNLVAEVQRVTPELVSPDGWKASLGRTPDVPKIYIVAAAANVVGIIISCALLGLVLLPLLMRRCVTELSDWECVSAKESMQTACASIPMVQSVLVIIGISGFACAERAFPSLFAEGQLHVWASRIHLAFTCFLPAMLVFHLAMKGDPGEVIFSSRFLVYGAIALSTIIGLACSLPIRILFFQIFA